MTLLPHEELVAIFPTIMYKYFIKEVQSMN